MDAATSKIANDREKGPGEVIAQLATKPAVIKTTATRGRTA
jgi:hypothetical protein